MSSFILRLAILAFLALVPAEWQQAKAEDLPT